jgi:outer membrane protein OmpA-like peptidoglycan-associated protein
VQTVAPSAPEVAGLPAYEPSDPDLPGVTNTLDLGNCTKATSLDNRVLQFGRDSAELPSSGPGYDELLKVIDSFKGAESLTVVGYTSYSDGTRDHNVELSRQRADAVAGVVRARLGISPHTDGLGPEHPVSKEDGTEASRIPNRRVEISGKIKSDKCTQG